MVSWSVHWPVWSGEHRSSSTAVMHDVLLRMNISTYYPPIESILVTTCSLFDTSVISSTISVKNEALWIDVSTSRNTCQAIIFRISFWISGAVYLSVFFFKQVVIALSSSLRNIISWRKLESDLSSCPFSGSQIPYCRKNFRKSSDIFATFPACMLQTEILLHLW